MKGFCWVRVPAGSAMSEDKFPKHTPYLRIFYLQCYLFCGKETVRISTEERKTPLAVLDSPLCAGGLQTV